MTRAAPQRETHIVVSTMSAIVVATIAVLVLLGWVFDITALKAPYGPITMKTNAAIGLLLGATSLGAMRLGWRGLGATTAAAAAILGAVTFLQHLTGWNFGIDGLLFSEAAGAAATASPNRMGPNASLSFALAGTALLLLYRGSTRAVAWGQRFALAGAVLATLAIAGYLNGAVELYAISRFTGIALHTAAALLVLHVGILSSRVDAGPVAVFVAEGTAGTLIRRLAVPILLIPLALGYLIGMGRSADLFDRGVSLALFSVSVIIMFGGIVWHTTASVAAEEASRRAAEHERDLLLVREREARDEAERASRLKDQFLAVLSHELRTPLNVMLGWTRQLESDAPPEQHARAAGIVARNGRLLARLVEDLLDVSRASAGQFEVTREPVAVSAVVTAVVDAMTPVARARHVRIESRIEEDGGYVNGDAQRLQQVVTNLLSNAIKFTRAGTVQVTVLRDGSSMVVRVTDQGIGFDEAFARELFQPFRQADASFRREFGGLGLGLSIAKHIAELHGGTLTGTSPGPGAGATFELRVPVIPAAAARSVDPSSATTPAARV